MKAKPRLSAGTQTNDGTGVGSAVKLSVNVSSEVGTRLRRIAFDERLSESSIVEIALELLFEKSTDAQIGKFFRENGASLRRGAREVATVER